MATLFRIVVVHAMRFSVRRCTSLYGFSSTSRYLSTSGKKEDTPVVIEPPPPSSGYSKRYGLYDKSSGPAQPENRDWITYGFSEHSEKDDRYGMMLTGIGGISILFVFGAFTLAYMPDLKAVDWTLREAYLELHRREKLGLPLIGKDLVDPSKFELPSEEELGDTEIII